MEIVMPKSQTGSAPHVGQKRPTIISVLSGKGGVGKTILSANLAVALAAEMREILLFDCDLTAGQSHMVLGISPTHGLAQVVRGEKELGQILVKGCNGLYLAPGGPSGGSAVELKGAEIRRLIVDAQRAVPSLRAVVLDVGAGRPAAASDFAGVADVPLVMTTPEPTAIRATLALLEAILSERPNGELYVVVNMASGEQEARETFSKIANALLPVFSGDLKYLGWVPFDLEITRSLWRYRPVVSSAPRSRAARGFLALQAALTPLVDGRGGVETSQGTMEKEGGAGHGPKASLEDRNQDSQGRQDGLGDANQDDSEEGGGEESRAA